MRSHDGAATPFFWWLCCILRVSVWVWWIICELRSIKPILINRTLIKSEESSTSPETQRAGTRRIGVGGKGLSKIAFWISTQYFSYFLLNFCDSGVSAWFIYMTTVKTGVIKYMLDPKHLEENHMNKENC